MRSEDLRTVSLVPDRPLPKSNGSRGDVAAAGGTADLAMGVAHFRADLSRWGSVFLTDERWTDGQARSVRWFDRSGNPVLEIHVPVEGWGTLDFLAAGFADPDQSPGQDVDAEPLPKEALNDDIDVKELRAAWDRLNPRTPFSSLLVRFGIGRPQAYRLAGSSRAEPVDPVSVCRIACHARRVGRPLAVRVHAGTSSLAYAGPITGQAMADGELRIVAPCLAASIQLGRIHSAWSVTRPSVDGTSSVALECYDEHDRLLVGAALPTERYVDYV